MVRAGETSVEVVTTRSFSSVGIDSSAKAAECSLWMGIMARRGEALRRGVIAKITRMEYVLALSLDEEHMVIVGGVAHKTGRDFHIPERKGVPCGHLLHRLKRCYILCRQLLLTLYLAEPARWRAHDGAREYRKWQ